MLSLPTRSRLGSFTCGNKYLALDAAIAFLAPAETFLLEGRPLWRASMSSLKLVENLASLAVQLFIPPRSHALLASLGPLGV